jgi:hypothetical protein
MWEAIQYVSSGFTLCAFIVAAISWIIAKRDKAKRDLIALAPEAERGELVTGALEILKIDPVRFSRQQQYDTAMRQLGARIEKLRIVASVVVVQAVLGAGLSAFAIYELLASRLTS